MDRIDWPRLRFGRLQCTKGFKTAAITYQGEPLTLRTPLRGMLTPGYGMSMRNANKPSLKLTFEGHDTYPALSAFRDMLLELDERVIDHAHRNQREFFHQQTLRREDVAARYHSLVQQPNAAYPEHVTLKVPVDKQGRPTLHACDAAHRTILDLRTVDMCRASVTAVIRCDGLWLAGGKFGVTLTATAMQVTPKPGGLQGFCFRDAPHDDV
jgi:hypothetical protein